MIVSYNVLWAGGFWADLRSAGHGTSGVPDALIRLPRRALPSRNDLFHSKKQGTRSGGPHRPQYQIPNLQAEGPNIIYEVSKLPPRLVGERSFRLGSPPRRRGDRVRRD